MDSSLHEISGDYYMDIREFGNGAIEVVLKAIRPMHENLIRASVDSDSYLAYCRENGLPTGFEARKSFEEHEENSEFKNLENHERAVRRAKQKIRWKCKQLQADRLFTLTYRANQEDRELTHKHFTRFLRLVKSGWKGQQGIEDWQYVAVLERQERGAYHIHCAVRGWQRVSFLRAAWYKALGGTGQERGEETPGNVDVTGPGKARWGTQLREWKTEKLVAYITKYLAKTFEESATEKRRYWSSRALEEPRKDRHILCARDFVSAIIEAVSVLGLLYDHALDFTHSWVSKSGDSFWLSLGGA